MADFDPFDALRDAGRNAVVPEATAVRARGRQRQQRQRVLYAATAVVVLVGAVSAGVAVAGSGSSASINPPATQGPTLIATEEPTPTETPSAEPTSTPTEAPTSSTPSPDPTPHATVVFAVTGVSGSNLTYSWGYDGLVPQLYAYDSSAHTSSPMPLKYPQDEGTEVIVDGVSYGGNDAGEVTCDPGARLVPVHFRSRYDASVALTQHGQPTPLSAGQHEAVLKVRFCEQGKSTGTSYQKRVTFTV